jgi:hypothetical protein
VHYIPAEAATGLCELWKDDVSAQQDETECVFCNEAYGTEKFARLAHLSRHMVEIALLLPRPIRLQDVRTNVAISAPLALHFKKNQIKEYGEESTPFFAIPTGSGHKHEKIGEWSLEERNRPLSPAESTDEKSRKDNGDSDAPDEAAEPPHRVVKKAEFILEEIDSDADNGDLDILAPSAHEDAKEDEAPEEHKNVLERLRMMHAASDSSDDEEQERRYRRKKKQWSAGIFKRSHSQSVEGDSSYSDNDPLDDQGSSARRLRRRVRGSPGGRRPLIFEEKGSSNEDHTVEVEEPDGAKNANAGTSVPEDDGFTLDELPFWDTGAMSEMELDSS